MSTPWRHTFTVPFHHADPAGVMFFARLFDHAHDAYEGWTRAQGMGLDPLQPLPLVHVRADYLHPMRPGDRICIHMTLEELEERRFQLGYRFVDQADRERAVARTIHVAVDPASGRATHLDPRLREALNTLERSAGR